MEVSISNASEILDSLNRTYSTIQARKGKSVRHAQLKNLKISASGETLRIENSIARYHNDNNLHPLTPRELSYAIRNLGDALHVDLTLARVTRVDLAGNIELDGVYTDFSEDSLAVSKRVSIAEYLQTFRGLPDFSKTSYADGETITYFLGEGEERFTLYDKVAEIKQKAKKDKDIIIPKEIEGRNIMRLESTLGYGRPSNLYKRPVIMKDLTGKDFYTWMCSHWFARYSAIRKERTLVPISLQAKTSKQLEVYLASIGATYLGDTYLSREMKALPSNERSNAKYLLGTKLKKQGCMKHNTYVEELNTKVKAIYESSIGR